MMSITIYGLNWMKMVEQDMTRNCSRDDLDLTAENMCSVIEFLIIGTDFLHTLSILAMFKMHVSCEIRSHKVLSLLL